MENTQLIFQKAVQAVDSLNKTDDRLVREVLLATADALEVNIASILMFNQADLSRFTPENPKYDRLKLTEERVRGMATDMRKVADMPSPLDKVLMEVTRPNGMVIRKISVPFGVIGVIYEARPNVTCDVFALCLKSGNVCILKGGSDAYLSNRVLVEIIREELAKLKVNPNVCSLLPPDRSATTELLNAVGKVDLIIPRGSSSLIQFVRENARVPVIETGAGICHTYFDLKGDRDKGRDIIFNAKTRRVSVCNALDCVLIHSSRLADLPYLCNRLAEKNVIIYADIPAYLALEGNYPSALLQHAERQHYGIEFLDYKMSIRTVSSLQDALHHISLYSSKHSECIISDDKEIIAEFQRVVDAACVYANVSTAFTDGAQFGFGAEIGISTQKLHARGPMALPELTTYKYLITGDGQIRS